MGLKVTIILRNNTNELLTIEDANVVQGEWVDDQQPFRENVIPKQSSGMWGTFGDMRTMGNMSIGSTKGYISIEWDFGVGIHSRTGLLSKIMVPKKLNAACELNRSIPESPVLLLKLQPGDRNGLYACGEVDELETEEITDSPYYF